MLKCIKRGTMGFRFNARPQILRKLVCVIVVLVTHEHPREGFGIDNPVHAPERPLSLPCRRLVEFRRLRPAVGKDKTSDPIGRLSGIREGDRHATEQ